MDDDYYLVKQDDLDEAWKLLGLFQEDLKGFHMLLQDVTSEEKTEVRQARTITNALVHLGLIENRGFAPEDEFLDDDQDIFTRFELTRNGKRLRKKGKETFSKYVLPKEKKRKNIARWKFWWNPTIVAAYIGGFVGLAIIIGILLSNIFLQKEPIIITSTYEIIHVSDSDCSFPCYWTNPSE